MTALDELESRVDRFAVREEADHFETAVQVATIAGHLQTLLARVIAAAEQLRGATRQLLIMREACSGHHREH